MRLDIAKEFSDIPLGLYRKGAYGERSAETFREDFLGPRLKQSSPKDPLIVDLSGAEGYPASFLEHSFGALVSKGYFTKKELKKILKIEARSGYKMYRDALWEYIDEAQEPVQ